jgi:NAD(P)-dependent dehydrogenase (short-subunit alcohol dehydrogenase family)
MIADIDGTAAQTAAVAIAETGGTASAVATDVAQERHIQHAVDHALQTHGRLDVFVNIAGVTPGCINGEDDA